MGWEDIPEETTSSKAMLKAVVDSMTEEQAALFLATWQAAKMPK